MKTKDSLGDRMKGYESVSKSKLIRRMPVVIRLDGKAFHTYTKRCGKPYDSDLHHIRQETLNYICNNIQGCILGYSQSDEISLILKDWTKLTTSAWFDNNLQKLVSVSASMCTAHWNYNVVDAGLSDKFKTFAMFDSRAFNIPREEVVNYLIWRQQDWERNSKQMLARAYFSHKECNNLNCQQLITKVENEKGIIWGNLQNWKKQGEVWYNGGLRDDFIFKNERYLIESILNEEE